MDPSVQSICISLLLTFALCGQGHRFGEGLAWWLVSIVLRGFLFFFFKVDVFWMAEMGFLGWKK